MSFAKSQSLWTLLLVSFLVISHCFLKNLFVGSYHGDPVLNPLAPWDKPPIKNIFCIYGIDSKTEAGYYFAPSDKPYPGNWIITDVIYEFEGSLFSRSGNQVEGNPGPASGDETSEHDGSHVQIQLNVQHQHKADIVPNMKKLPRVKYITYYEDSESIPGKRTGVWELDKGSIEAN